MAKLSPTRDRLGWLVLLMLALALAIGFAAQGEWLRSAFPAAGVLVALDNFWRS